MFANFVQLITGRLPPEGNRDFIRDVTVIRRKARNPRTEKLILAGWLLILAKSWLMIWLVARYHIPINADWVILPTVVFAALCTAVYFWRR